MNKFCKTVVIVLFLMTLSGCRSYEEQNKNISVLQKKNDKLTTQINDSTTTIQELESTINHLNEQIEINEVLRYEQNQKIDELMSANDELMSANNEMISPSFVSQYIPHKWSLYGGYYNYVSDESPLIYPNKTAPQVNKEVKQWLIENPLVEVIMRTNNNLYLVRIPTIENYVYVNESSLKALELNEIYDVPEVDITVNDCNIGDSVDKLKLTFDGISTYGVENGTKMVGFFDVNSESVFEEKGLAFVDEYKRIIGFRFSSDDFVLDNKYTIGDLAKIVIDYYDKKFGRDESYKDNGYSYNSERYIYVIGEYYIELNIDTDELSDNSLITSVWCKTKWW